MKKSETKKLDKLWSQSVKNRANNKCEYCGRTDNLDAHHLNNRVIYSLRWDLENGVCLCKDHHRFNRKFAAHNTPSLFEDWIFDRRDIGYLEEMIKVSDIYLDYEEVSEFLSST